MGGKKKYERSSLAARWLKDSVLSLQQGPGVNAVVQVQSLAQELPHAVSVPPPQKKRREEKTYEI